MWKRILVLVLFLLGVFWWLSSRDGTPEVKTASTETVEVVESEDDENDTDESDEEDSDDEETEDSEDEEQVPAPTPTTQTNKTVAKSTVVAPKPVVTAPVKTYVAPAVTKPAPQPVAVTPAPVVAEPEPVPVIIEEPVEEVVEVVAPVIPAITTNTRVYMYEWGLDLSKKTLPAGTIAFTVQNSGRFPHDFAVEGHGNLGKLMPGESAIYRLPFAPGSYEVYSDRRDDRSRGVTDVITVQ